MAELVDDDEQIKKDEDLEDDEKDAKGVNHIGLVRKAGLQKTKAASNFREFHFLRPNLITLDGGTRFLARRQIGPQYCIEIGVRNVGVPVHHLFHRLPDARKRNSLLKES
jgi:hypothetical protein